MSGKRFSIEVSGKGAVSAIRTDAPQAGSGRLYAYAPGAGANLDDPFGRYLAECLPSQGLSVLRFQFPYMEAGRRAPDRPPVLEAAWRAVIAAARPSARVLLIGGRSMGGRIASMVAAEDDGVDGLALFAYPLHQPGKPERLRDGHFGALDMPVLFCSGTRDSFATPAELTASTAKAPDARVHILQGADHGFAARKKDGRTREEIWAEAADALIAFASGLSPTEGAP